MKLHLPKGLRTALIAALSLFSGFAATVGSAAYADAFLPSLTDDAGNKAITWKSGSLPNGWNANLTATGVAAGLKSLNMTAPGWYNFVNNGQNAYPNGTETSLTATGFRFNGRQGYGGEAVIANVSVADILAGTTDNTLTSFTISFDGTAATNGLKFSVWAWDGTEATSLVAMSSIGAGTFDTQTFSASDLNMKETDSIIVSWYNSSGGALNTINNLTTTFTSKYDAANEGPRNLTWDLGTSCNWADEVWTLNGGKVAFKDGDSIYFPKLDASFRRISVDGEVAVGNITVQAGNMDSTTITGTAAANMTVESLSLGTNAEFAFAGFENLTFKTVTTESGAEVDFSSVTGKLSVTSKLTGAAENTIILAVIADSITDEAPDLYLTGAYANPTEINKAINSIASLDSLAAKDYIDESDVNRVDLLGSIIFTDKQSSVQPGTSAATLDIDKRKVVFDKGIAFFGSSMTNGNQAVNIKNLGEMTVNGEALENLRMTINVTTGGKLTATEGIILGHPENGDYPAWLNLKSAEITTKTITSRNRDARTAFTMSSEVYQIPGNPRPTEQGGTLTITGDSAFGLANGNAKFTVNLNAGTLTSTSTSMNLVDAAYADSANITIGIGGTFNITAKEGNTITINHALTGAGTGTSTVSGTLVFNGAGTVAIANGVDLGNISFNQTNGTLTLAGAITLGDTATFTQTAGKKILLTALEGAGDVSFSNYEGGAAGNGLQQSSAVDVITGGTLNSDVVVTYNGKDYTLTNDNRSIGAEGGTSTTYYVNTATADMSKITAFSADITTVELAGGNLIMDTAKPTAISLDVTADSTLTINEGITVNKTDLTVGTGKTLTLAGAGTYTLGDAALGATLGTDWTGTVQLKDCTINGLTLNNYANTAGGSSVELSGVDGYFARSNTSAANIILTNSGDKAAYSVTNGYTGTTVTFNGNVSGTGDFQRGNNKGGTQNYAFNGDVSGWTGKAQLASGADATNFIFGGKATEINASVVQKSGAALGLTITNNEAVAINGTIGADGGTGAINITTDGTGAKTFNGTVEATALTVNAGSAIFKDSLTASGTVTVASGATLDLSGATSATVGTLNLAGGSTLALGSDALTVTNLTLTDVSGSSLLTIQGLGTDAALFTGLAAETNIANITFMDKQGKRVASAADYISGASGWLVYDAASTTLSLVSSLSPDLFWTTGTGTWDAAALWSKAPDAAADSTFVEEGNITFAGQTGVTVTLATPATAGTVTIKDGDYTFDGEQLTILNGLAVKDADATFQNGADLKDATVTVGADSTLTIGKDTTMKSLSNEGTVDLGANSLTLSTSTTKGGTVTAGDVTLTGDNTFTKLTTSGKVSGASALILGDGSSIGSIADGTGLTVKDGAVTIGADTKLGPLDNGGTLDLGANSLTLTSATTKGGTVNAKDVTLTGDNTFTKLTASGKVSGASALSVGDGSSIASLADGTGLTTAGTVTIGADTKLSSLDNGGTLDLGGNSLTLTSATAKGGTVTAGDVTLTGANSFTNLNATGAVTGADSLTLGGDSTLGSLADGTKLTVNAGTATIGADTTLGSLAGAGKLTTDGTLTVTDGGSIGDLTVNGGTLTISSPLTVTGTLTGVTSLEVTTLPANGPVLTAGSIASNGISFVTTEDLLTGLNLDLGSTWTLISQTGNGTPDVTFASTGTDTMAFGESKYVLSNSGNSVIISRLRGGNEWNGGDAAVTWDGAGDGWSGGAPSDSVAANFLGSGPADVVVVGDQSASKILVDTANGTTTEYTLSGDDVTVGGLELISGGLGIGNNVTATDTIVNSGASLSINDGGTLTTDTLTVADADAFTIGQGATLELTSGSVDNGILAGSKGTVIMDTLTDGGTIGGTIELRKDSTFNGNYSAGTTIISRGGMQKLKADGNLTISGGKGSFELTGGSALGGIDTTGADITLTGTDVALGNASSMKCGTLTLGFSAKNAIEHAGDKGGVEKAFTGESLTLNGVTIVLNQTETGSDIKVSPVSGTETKGIVLFTISDAAGSTFDDSTTIKVNSDLLEKYYTNFRLEQGSINLVADRETKHYTKKLNALSPNGATGLALADYAMTTLAPQENAPDSDLAAVMDALDQCVQDGKPGRADRIGAALAGSATTALGSALAGDMDRQLRAIRNRTTSMGAVPGVIMEDAMPNIWFTVEGDYSQLNAERTASGYKMNSVGGSIGADYNISPNTTLGLAVTAMYGKLTADSAEQHAEGNVSTYYLTAFGRYAQGAWVNTLVASVGVSDLSLDRTIIGDASATGDTSGLSFGMLYELAYTIPVGEEHSTCLQPVVNVQYKHTHVGGYKESGSDAALRVGGQDLDSFTLGAGFRMQTAIGQTIYNRASALELRALAKLQAGDRSSSADVALMRQGGRTGSVKGAEVDAFGVELGASLFIPVGVDSGTLFFDVSAELRSNAPTVTGTVGYRISF